ncbi:hypothetical protein CHX27_09375 [Flavobacterium aurantiibacter]|uniref:Uncharacterized protein n=1 Tax=Flavobacterium aurantiibacter TaxID=2023067 RepID=A0A255ZQK0_9FLAO|nr:hypothetical protein CHX27_09375 [Flavobacterium aurantiibacter]
MFCDFLNWTNFASSCYVAKCLKLCLIILVGLNVEFFFGFHQRYFVLGVPAAKIATLRKCTIRTVAVRLFVPSIAIGFFCGLNATTKKAFRCHPFREKLVLMNVLGIRLLPKLADLKAATRIRIF